MIDVKKARWMLAEKLIQEQSAIIIPLRPRDKIPAVKEWQKRTETTLDELNEWWSKNQEFNFGLVLGSNFVAIDVDGADGDRILQELSDGDLPQTVTYTTPNSGKRYLYRIHEQDKEKVFKKYIKTGEGEHNECALMGMGQQTALPYNIHPNGGVYEFVEGLSFDDVEVAYVPEWMKKLMTEKSGAAKEADEAQPDSASDIPPEHSAQSEDLEYVCSKCSKLQELLLEQKTSGLHEEKWFLVMCLLAANGHPALAREFSALSSKHNNRSDQRIEQILSNGTKGSPRCTTLGCTEKDIKNCFGKVYKNKNGEVTNSPRKLIRNSRLQNEKIGFIYDENGNFSFINGNIFARHILANFNVVTNGGALFYMYDNNYWHEISEHALKKMFRKFFNSYEMDKWSSLLQKVYWDNFTLEAPDVSELTKSHDYINVQNGLLSLNTMQLEPHNCDVFTTVQLPVDYDPAAKCPTFEYYLNDVFQGNTELIHLSQEILGYCIGYSVKAQKIFILLGEGANGKSLFCNIAIALCGERNVASVSLRGLSKQFAKAALVDKLLNVSTENELNGDSLDTQDVKSISAGDLIEVERKFMDSYQVRLYVKLLYAVNRLPYSKDNSYAIARRLILLPFDKTYVEANPNANQGLIDLTLEDRILAELSGVLNFALEGLQRLKANSYVFSKAVKSADVLTEYMLELNPFLDFVKNCVEPADPDSNIETDKKVEIADFIAAFRKWCRLNSHRKLLDTSMKRFLKEIRIILKTLNIPFTEKKSDGKQYVCGVRISNELRKARLPEDLSY